MWSSRDMAVTSMKPAGVEVLAKDCEGSPVLFQVDDSLRNYSRRLKEVDIVS